MQGLTRGLARRDPGHFNIRVNAGAHALGDDGEAEASRGSTTRAAVRSRKASASTRNSVCPRLLARMALFLAADDSRMITAQDIVVDGGGVRRA